MVHSDNDFATVAYLRIKKASLHNKPDAGSITVTVPPTLSDSYTPISDTIASHSALPSPSGAESKHPPHELAPPFATKQIGRWVAVANVQSRIVVQQELSIEDEVRECFDKLRGKRSFCSTSATIQYSPISSVPRQALPHPSQLRKYQHLPLFHGPIGVKIS